MPARTPPKDLDLSDGHSSRHHAAQSSLGHLAIRRGVHLPPSILTTMNLLCGGYAISVIADRTGHGLNKAALAIWVGWAFDAVDGPLARGMGLSSAFVKELDSLADIVTFGIAPSLLAYVWAFKPLTAHASQGSTVALETGWVIGLFYIVCCAWRLARFNLQVTKPAENRFLVGLPAPASALLIAALVHSVGHAIKDVRFSWLLASLLVVLGLLMLSSVRHYSFKDLNWNHRQPHLSVILIVFVVISLLFSRVCLLVISGAYALHGPVVHFLRAVRHNRSDHKQS